jgi:hypothetical protein
LAFAGCSLTKTSLRGPTVDIDLSMTCSPLSIGYVQLISGLYTQEKRQKRRRDCGGRFIVTGHVSLQGTVKQDRVKHLITMVDKLVTL